MEKSIQVVTFEAYLYQTKQKLKEAGYRNKSIPYYEVETLYKLFNDSLTFEDFVVCVLEIKWDTYCNAKYLKHDVVVLMDRDRLGNEEINQLVCRLIQLGYAMKKIGFDELLQLHSTYGDGLTLKTFAIRVLKLTPRMYQKCRSGSSVWILQNVGDIPSIQAQMKQDGFENFLIEEFSTLEDLYQFYGKEFTQKAFFRDVLNITDDQIKKLKRSHTAIPIFQKEEIESVVTQLEEYGYEEASIDYQEFCSLYQIFKMDFLNELDFAHRGLRLTREEYSRLRRRGYRVKVLKMKKRYSMIAQVWKILIAEHYLEKSISYLEFLELFARFGPMLSQDITELEFATIALQIGESSFYTMQGGKNAIILKELTKREIETIQLRLISYGYAGAKISYAILQNLHQRFAPFLSERQFAIRVLLLSSDNYRSAKRGYRVTILASQFRLSVEEVENCRKAIQEMGFANQSLDSDTCEKLYSTMGLGTNRTIFFCDVLENYYSHDSKNSHKVLPSRDVLMNDEKNQIRSLLHSQGIYYRKLTPNQVDALFLKYGSGLSFQSFLEEILGTSLHRYNEALKHQRFLCITNPILEAKMKRIYELSFKEARYYSQKELYYICQIHQVDLKDLIYYYFLKSTYRKNEVYLNDYLKILQTYGQLWFGKGKLDSSIFAKYYEVILIKSKIAVREFQNRFPSAYSCGVDASDDVQNALLVLLENGQDLEKNFIVYQNPLWERYCYGILKKNIERRVFDRIRAFKKNSSIPIDNLGTSFDFDANIIDDYNSVSLIEMLTEEINGGSNVLQAIDNVSSYFQLSKQEIYSVIDEIIKKNPISKDVALSRLKNF